MPASAVTRKAPKKTIAAVSPLPRMCSPAQAAKAQQAEVATIRKQLDELKAKVETDDRYRAAEADLTRLEQARAKDPLKAAERLGWENPTTLRNAVREALSSVRRWQEEGARPFDPFRTDAELKAFVKDRLAPYKYPRLIEFVNDLPKTATGKIQRFKLREREKPAA